MIRFIPILTIQLGLSIFGSPAIADEGATLKGKLLVSEKWTGQIQPNSVHLELVEEVQVEQPPLPDNWASLNGEERNKWLQEFRGTVTGKEFFEQQQKRLSAARKFDVPVEPDGNFSIYDVPPAVYSLQGHRELKIEDRDYIVEVFGQIEVVKEADEVLLGDLELIVSAILTTGQDAPDFQLKSINGEAVSLANFRGKLLLVNFWSVASPPATKFQQDLQAIALKLNATHPLDLLAISLDEDSSSVARFAKENNFSCTVALAGGWGNPVISDYGVSVIPSLWLVDRQGKLLATDNDLGTAIRDSGMSLEEILAAVIEGRAMPKKQPTPPPTKK